MSISSWAGLRARAALVTTFIVPGISIAGPVYVQTNLTSDIPGLAANVDTNLKNPWGVSFAATSPFWVSDQVTNMSTLYNATGVPQGLKVAMPAAPHGPSGPTGQVFNGTSGFQITPNAPALFLFSTLAGTVAGWNQAAGTTAVTRFTAVDGASYTGLTMGTVGSNNFLYAADTKNGKIDVLDTSFNKVTLSGSFTDPSVPAGFAPYNVQNIGGKLYVEYAKLNTPGGYVGVFDTSGNLLQHISDAHFNAPWGAVLAPAGFGAFGNDLLIGNFGDGTINAFDPTTGGFVGTLSDTNGKPIVNSGLWALEFRAPGGTFDPNALYFTAGINNQADGLFGTIQVVPEPATLGFAGIALVAGIVVRVLRKK